MVWKGDMNQEEGGMEGRHEPGRRVVWKGDMNQEEGGMEERHESGMCTYSEDTPSKYGMKDRKNAWTRSCC